MNQYDVVVVGTGPGGYVSAIRAAQLGLSVATVEDDRPGGVCLNWGCIPTKALLRNAEIVQLFERAETFGITVQGMKADYAAAVQRSRSVADRMAKGVEFLFRKNKITLFPGTGSLKGKNVVEVRGKDGPPTTLEAGRAVILATGSEPRSLSGVAIDEKTVISSNGAVRNEAKPKSIVVIGAGAVGVEFADVYRSYGVEVTRFEAQQVLMAVGRAARTKGVGLEALGVAMERGFVKVSPTMETSVKGVYAIGDMAGVPLLAHKAMAEGVVAAEAIAGKSPRPVDYGNVPSCTYCRPQIASIGLTEARARENGREVTVGKFPFTANGKAVALGETEGFIKVIADKATGELRGVHIVGPEATEIIHEFAVGRTLEATVDEIMHTIHAHPTLSEAALEATLAALGQAIHI